MSAAKDAWALLADPRLARRVGAVGGDRDAGAERHLRHASASRRRARANVESRNFFGTGGARLYGLTLFHELMSVERASIGLALLAAEIEAGRLKPQIAVEAGWSEVGAIAKRLIDRDFTGKAVLHIG